MKHLKTFFAFMLMAFLSIGQVWGADQVYSGTVAKVDANGDQTMNGVAWTITSDNTSGLGQSVNATKGAQIGSGSKPTKALTFETTGISGTIKQVVVNTSGASGFSGTVSVTVGSTAFLCNSASTASLTTSAANYTFTGEASGKITISWSQTTSKAIYVKTISVTYGEVSSCTSEITITKADDPANGIFALDNSGTVCIDEGNATVNVTATPNTGYHLATVVSAEGTIGDIEGNTCQITNIGASTTISVTFAENPKYKVSFNVGGSAALQSPIEEASAGAGITLPAGPTPTCSADGWEFAGWKETSGVAEETTTAPTLLAAASSYHPTANCTLFAVYKRTEAGSGVAFARYEQVASNPEDWSGQYLLAANTSGTTYYTFSGKTGATAGGSTEHTPGTTEKTGWEVTVAKTTNGYSLYHNSEYLGLTSDGNNLNFNSTFSASNYEWTLSYDNGAQSVAYPARYIECNTGSSFKVACYKATQKRFYLYKRIEEEASTTYYLSSPTCCTQHAVNIAAGITNGSVSADPASACEGATITLTFTPALNYHLSAWTLNGDDQDVAENTFTMPNAAVTVSATFAQDACDPLGTPSVTVSGKTYPYDAVQLAWTAIEHADAYKVYIYDNEDNELEHNDAFTGVEYTIGQTLSANTTYKYSVQAISNTPATYCPSTEAENTFTTDALPTAHLTLIALGEEQQASGDYAILTPFALPSTAASCAKTFMGWDANSECASAPTYAKGAEFTFQNTTGVTLYAVYADETPGAATLTKLNGSSMPVAGDKIVIVGIDTNDDSKHALYQETSGNSYVKHWAFDNNVATVAADAKKYVTLEAANDGKFYLGDATNGYVYSSGSNNLSVDLTNKTAWTIAWDADASAFTFNQGRYLSCRSDLTGDNTYLYRLAGGTPAGIWKLDVYKYGTSASTYSNYATTCSNLLDNPTFSLDPVVAPVNDKYEEAINVVITNNAGEGTIYYTTNGENPTSASDEYTDPITLNTCGTKTIKAIVISATNHSEVVTATYEMAIPIPSVSAEDPYTEAEAVAVYNSGCYDNEDVWVTGTVQTAQFFSSSSTYTITLTNGFQFYYFYESFNGEDLVPFSEDYIVAGDVLIAKGKLGKHNTTYQIANGYLVSRTPVQKTSIANDIDHPYTVAEAIAFCNDPITYDLNDNVYIQGVAAGAPNNAGTFNIYDAGAETTLFQLYKSNLGSFDDIKELDVVIAYGKIEYYNSTTYEMNQGEVVDVTPYVAPTVDVTGVEVDETATVKVGKTVQLTATVLPVEATNKNVTWSVKEGSEAYAEVSATGVVTGLAEGVAIIIVTTEDGGFTDECTVTVNPIAPANTDIITAEGIGVEGNSYVAWTGKTGFGTSSVYAGNSTNATNPNAGALQLRYNTASDKQSGIVLTESNGMVLKGLSVSVKSGSNTLNVYAKATAYSGYADLYSDEEDVRGKLIGTVSATGAMTLEEGVSYDDNYQYIGMRSANGALYLDDITITWGDAVTPEPPVLDWTEGVRTGLTAGYYYTMCLDKAVTNVRGASIWRVLSKAQNGTDIILEEVTSTLDAGRPYFFYATAATMDVVYTGDAVGNPLTEGNNGLVGSFEQYLIPQSNTNFILYNNQLYYVNSDNVYVGAHRAYLDMTDVPAYNAGNAAPGRRRVTMQTNGEKVATGMDEVNVSETAVKMIIDDQLFILRGEKMYDAMGRLVK